MQWHFAVLMKGSRGAMPSAEDRVLQMTQHSSLILTPKLWSHDPCWL